MECIVRGVPIFYETFGSGQPIIILHGTPIEHRAMQACLEPIFLERNDEWKRIYIDLPGHGKTPGVDWITNNEQMVDVVIGFIEAISPNGNFTLIGESYGGYLARGVLHSLRERIDALFLWTPAKYPRAERKRPSRIVLAKDDRLAEELVLEVEKDIFRLQVIQSEKAVDFMRSNVMPGWQMADEKFISKVLDTKFSFEPESEEFNKPTLIACGRQDFVVGYQDSYELLEKYPMATFAVLNEAGHLLGFTEQKDAFKALVDEWLNRIQASK
jgi:pimeloyl-ACP methyl ester carboxylesterase